MKDRIQRSPLLAALAAVALLLVIVVGAEAVFGPGPRSVLAAVEHRKVVPADAKLLPSLAIAAPEQAYPDSVARSLFLPTRRPAPEAPVSAQGVIPKGQYILQGVIVVGDNRIAMVREKSNGRIHRIERGKDFNGLKVIEIERESVTLAQGNDQEKLLLSVQKLTPAAAPAAASAGPFAAYGVPPGGVPPAGAPPAPQAPPVPGAPPQGFGPFQKPAAGAPPATAAAKSAPTATPEAAAADSPPLSPEDALARRRAARRVQPQAN